MKLWTVMLMFVMAFAVACGSGDTPADQGGQPDVIDQDVPGEDTNVPVDTSVPEVGEDTNVPVDTNVPKDEGGTDTNVPTDEGTNPDTNVACPTGINTGAACNQAAACAVLCDDETFETTCLAQADQAAADAWTALKACADTAECAKMFEGEQVSACIIDSCKTEADACLAGTQGCRDIWTCRKDCPAEDPTCAMACITSGTPDAQAQWIEYKNCILDIACASEDVMENGWPTFTCEQYARGFCSLPYQACFPPT